MKSTALYCSLFLGVIALGKRVNLDDDLEIGLGDDNIDVATLTNEKLQAAQYASKARARAAIASTKRHNIEFKFEGDSVWNLRGYAEVQKDADGNIVGLVVENEPLATITKETLDSKCKLDSLYQLRIPDFELFTSLPSCYFAKTGLNDTLIFHPDTTGTSLSSLSFDILDRDFLASVEKNPRKRRLLTTKYFDHFTTKALLQPLVEGARPIFTKYKYDSIGRELKEKQPGQPAAEEN